jgi:hypothetical protein
MVVSLTYVTAMMMLMARPVIGYLFRRVLGIASEEVANITPVVIALTLSTLLSVISLLAAERRLSRFSESD